MRRTQHHAARDAKRALRAVLHDREVRSHTYYQNVSKKIVVPQRKHCVVVEVYANTNSILCKMATRRKHTAFRVSYYKGNSKRFYNGKCGWVRTWGQRGKSILPSPRQGRQWRSHTLGTDLLMLQERKRLLAMLLRIRQRLRRYVRRPPMLLLTSPDCAAYSSLTPTNKAKMRPGRLALKRKHARIHLRFCRRVHAMFAAEPRTLRIHEAPQKARIPATKSTQATWPWAISKRAMPRTNYTRSVVHGCAVGLRTSKGELLKKPWVFENSGSEALPKMLRAMQCRGDHTHAKVAGQWSKCSAAYPPLLTAFFCRPCKHCNPGRTMSGSSRRVLFFRAHTVVDVLSSLRSSRSLAQMGATSAAAAAAPADSNPI